MRRWRVLHDSCTLDRASGSRTRIESAGDAAGGSAIGSAIVRSGRVATYTQLLSVLADLGRDGSAGFATTAWPNLLQRIAFDTNWELNGRKGMTDLGIENRSVLSSAGLGSKGGVIVEVPEVNAESIARQERKERQRQRKEQGDCGFGEENAGLVRLAIGERN